MDQTFPFAARDIAEMAADLELRGSEFYQKIAELKELEPAVREMFWNLSRQELGHRNSFLQIAAGAKSQDEEHEYAIDLRRHLKKSFLDILEKAAFDLSELGQGHIDMKAALAIAIHTEQASIELYEKMLAGFQQALRPTVKQPVCSETERFSIIRR